jgi:hypothetical protein
MKMNSNLSAFAHALKAEWVKSRRTFLRYSPIIFASSAFLVLLPSVLRDFTDGRGLHGPNAENILQMYSFAWIYLFLPVYSIFIALMNFYTEHTNCMWKHINVQPISGVVQVWTKHCFAWCYVAVSTIMLSAFILIILLIVKQTYSHVNIGLDNSAFWFGICRFSLNSIVGGIATVSILNLLAARTPGIIQTGIVGFAGILIPIFIRINHVAAPFVPWAMEKVYVFSAYKGVPYKPLWAIVPIVYVAIALARHIALQRMRPLY